MSQPTKTTRLLRDAVTQINTMLITWSGEMLVGAVASYDYMYTR